MTETFLVNEHSMLMNTCHPYLIAVFNNTYFRSVFYQLFLYSISFSHKSRTSKYAYLRSLYQSQNRMNLAKRSYSHALDLVCRQRKIGVLVRLIIYYASLSLLNNNSTIEAKDNLTPLLSRRHQQETSTIINQGDQNIIIT